MDASKINPAKTYLLKGSTLRELLRSGQKVIAGQGLDYKDNPQDGSRTIFLAKNDRVLPATVTGDPAGGKMRVAASAWQDGVDGAWTRLDEMPLSSGGGFVYLCIEQDSDTHITAVSYSVQGSSQDSVEMAGESPDYVKKSWVPLSEILPAPNGAPRVVQRRHGNFTIGTWAINGYAARWPETTAGYLPPEEPTYL
jgi:hypothetical protein